MVMQYDFIENLTEICSLHLAPMALTQLLTVAPKSLVIHSCELSSEKREKTQGNCLLFKLSAAGLHTQEGEAL